MMQGKNIVEEKVKQVRRSVMPVQKKGRGFLPAVKYEDLGMTQEVANSWTFNMLTISKQHKINLAMYSISRFHNPGDGYVNSESEVATLLKFVNQVEKEYLPNPFHNMA